MRAQPLEVLTENVSVAWPTIVKQHWRCHWLKTDDDIAAANAEITRGLGGRSASNDEIASAIRYMGAQHRVCPSLQQVIDTLRRRRKFVNEEQSGGACTLCVSDSGNITGWLDHFAGWREDWEEKDYMMAYPVTQVPCLCRDGQKLLSICATYRNLSEPQMDSLNAMRREAADQKRARQQRKEKP